MNPMPTDAGAEMPDEFAHLNAPEGFKPRHFGEGFTHVNGPLFTRKGPDGLQLGFRVEPRHSNPMGICHGGMIATFCDMLLPMTAHTKSDAAKNRFLPTINLQVDYLASAKVGAWVQGEAQVLRATRSLLFMQGLVSADGVLIARASGIFKIGEVFKFAPPG